MSSVVGSLQRVHQALLLNRGMDQTQTQEEQTLLLRGEDQAEAGASEDLTGFAGDRGLT